LAPQLKSAAFETVPCRAHYSAVACFGGLVVGVSVLPLLWQAGAVDLPPGRRLL